MTGYRSLLTIDELVSPLAQGSSQPWLARGSDGADYVVKFRGAGPGVRALAAELIVARLARHWGLPVPACAPIRLDTAPRVGTDELWDVLAASQGWNLAIEYIPGARDVPANPDQLPASIIRAIAWVDALFANYDRTHISSNLVADERDRIWLIDHGSCLILSRLAANSTFALAPNHFLIDVHGGEALAALLVGADLPSDAPIADLLADVPDDWLADLGLPERELTAALADRIRAFHAWVAGS